MYAVVRFLDTLELGIVCREWIIGNYATWHHYATPKSLEHALMTKAGVPSDSHQRPIEILHSTETYIEAVQFQLAVASDDSSESEIDRPALFKQRYSVRTRKPKKIWSFVASDGERQKRKKTFPKVTYAEKPSKSLLFSITRSKPLSGSSPIPEPPELVREATFEEDTVELRFEESEPHHSSKLEEKVNRLCDDVENQRETMAEVLKKLCIIEDLLRDSQDLAVVKTCKTPISIPQCNSLEELRCFLDRLEDTSYTDTVVLQLARVCTARLSTSINRMLARLISDILCKNLTWKNGPNRFPCCGTLLVRLIKESIFSVQRFRSATETEVETCIKNWLHGYRDRSGRRWIRKPK